MAARVSLPPEPLRTLLLTWPLRRVRDGLRVPPIVIPDHVLARGEWREAYALAAWDLEQRFGVRDVADRLELLRGAFGQLAGRVDIDSDSETAIVATLRRIKADTLTAYAETRGRAIRRRIEAKAEKVRQRLERALRDMIELRDAQYIAAPGDDPRAPSAAKYRDLLADELRDRNVHRASMRNRRGSPDASIVASARKELARVGIPPELAIDLLEAIGVTVPVTKKTRQKSK